MAGLAAVDCLGRLYDAPWDELTAEQQAFTVVVYTVRRELERRELAAGLLGARVT